MKSTKTLEIIKISEETKNGNLILTLRHKGTVKKGGFNAKTKTRGQAYLFAVEAESFEGAVGDTDDFNLEDYDLISNPFEGKDGQVVDIPWLVIK